MWQLFGVNTTPQEAIDNRTEDLNYHLKYFKGFNNSYIVLPLTGRRGLNNKKSDEKNS